MNGLMMDFPLTIPAIVRRAESLFGKKTVVSRRADRSIARASYADVLARARSLAAALQGLGIRPGDRVATLAWASQEHLEAYLAIPSIGAVLHTLNLRLHPDDLIYIINDAADRALLVDECLLPLVEKVRPHVRLDHVIVMTRAGGPIPAEFLDYETFLKSAGDTPRPATIAEEQAAAMCYTSGTTGRPKGVLYSHRALVLHSFCLALPDALGLSERDTILPVVPMFHVNAWGLPFVATMLGSNLVFPGPHLDPGSILELLVKERVTFAGGVPTVWLGVLQQLDQNPGAYDLGALRTITVGGSAAPPAMMRAYKDRHGVTVQHVWGMTEMTPLGTVCNLPSSLAEAAPDEQFRYLTKQGPPMPFVETRARNEQGLVPWDGTTMGELEVRGPWVAARYYNTTGPDARFTDDGWFRTGDIVTIDPSGCIEIADREKDLVKSGGEWISSVALENALMGHPAVLEAAVVAVPHPKWDERPLAVVVLRDGKDACGEELLAHLAPSFAKWWLPDAVEFAAAIPRTSAGKFKKSALREQYRNRFLS
jgi:fatty-acyl-CoA synthase